MFRQVEGSVLDRDPFWSQVRRRHPGVDVVLVPPGPPRARPAPPALPAWRREDVAAAAAAAWRAVLAAAFGACGGPSGTYAAWRPRAGGHALVLTAHRHGLGRDGGVEVLRSLLRACTTAGWQAETADRPRPVLRADAGGLVLVAQAGAAATTVELAGPPLTVEGWARREIAERVMGRVGSTSSGGGAA